jgi:hypothetical protein
MDRKPFPQCDVRPMGVPDLSAVVRLHQGAFDGYLTTILGNDFLKCFYSEFITGPEATAFVAVRECSVVGFVAGMTDPKAFYNRFYWKHFGRLGIDVLKGMIRDRRTYGTRWRQDSDSWVCNRRDTPLR